MTNPAVYSNLTFDELCHILRSDDDTQLQLLNERHQCLLESGKVLIEKFGGKLKKKKCWRYFSFSNTFEIDKMSVFEISMCERNLLWIFTSYFYIHEILFCGLLTFQGHSSTVFVKLISPLKNCLK